MCEQAGSKGQSRTNTITRVSYVEEVYGGMSACLSGDEVGGTNKGWLRSELSAMADMHHVAVLHNISPCLRSATYLWRGR